MESNESMHPPPPSYEEVTSTSTQPPVAAAHDKQNLRSTVPVIVQPMYETETRLTTTISSTPSTILLWNGREIQHNEPNIPFGPDPIYKTCPSCHVWKLTRIEYEPDMRTHLMAGELCLSELFCCACLPYCCDSCKNAVHYCGNCGAYLGSYKH